MGDAKSQDNDLLARLNALKKSHISLDTNGRPPRPRPRPDETTDLAARLKSLRAAPEQQQQRGPAAEEDAATRELAAAAAAAPLLLAGDVARDLLGDARDVLARSRAWTRSVGEAADGDADEVGERDVDDVLAGLVDEADGPDELPRVPSRDPLPLAPDADVAALPAAPRHDAAATWCAVCLDDAAVRCRGCGDGVLYCARCWGEAHRGPDVGRDVRAHPWTRFRNP